MVTFDLITFNDSSCWMWWVIVNIVRMHVWKCKYVNSAYI
jgi:hypothetical protein